MKQLHKITILVGCAGIFIVNNKIYQINKRIDSLVSWWTRQGIKEEFGESGKI